MVSSLAISENIMKGLVAQFASIMSNFPSEVSS
jgi:hypothetical protein